MKLVVVESPAKAKTIERYLGGDFKVVASMGHVRALPSKPGSVVPEEDFAMHYELTEHALKAVRQISELAKEAKEIFLATDPDREGEAIAWHVAEILRAKSCLTGNCKIHRATFYELTTNAVSRAIHAPRELDLDLVRAQQSRQALDYLVGFTLSPLLWRKLPNCKSAGRVQSVALRLICERENEVLSFKSQEYWSIELTLGQEEPKKEVSAKLIRWNGEELKKLSIKKQDEAFKIKATLEGVAFKVASITKKLQKRNPPAPFNTSSLQQEASKKLGFNVKKTMQLAQKLYEGVLIDGQNRGLITYMRTDGVSIADEALVQMREAIAKGLGREYVSEKPNQYKTKTKNAQEAHEAIRPTYFDLTPDKLANQLPKDQHELYTLIWQRSLSSQMKAAVVQLTSVDFVSGDDLSTARSNYSRLTSKVCYLALYPEKITEEEELQIDLSEGELLLAQRVEPKQHFTEPPARFTEAALVKKLEEMGIGRPSTYASIISVLLDRNYVHMEKKCFVPEVSGVVLTSFLKSFFGTYFDYGFTATLEDELDAIANGSMPWREMLSKFWSKFFCQIELIRQKQTEAISHPVLLELQNYLFPDGADDSKKTCPKCTNYPLNLRLGKFGPFLSCANYPACSFTRSVTQKGESSEEGKICDDEAGNSIFLCKTAYGICLKLELNGKTLKKVNLPPKYSNVDSDLALKLIKLPKVLCTLQGQDMSLNVSKFGFYLKCGDKVCNVPDSIHPLSIDENAAVELMNSAKPRSFKANKRPGKKGSKKR